MRKILKVAEDAQGARLPEPRKKKKHPSGSNHNNSILNRAPEFKN